MKVDELVQRYHISQSPSDLYQLRRLIQADPPDILLFHNEAPVTYVKQLRALENQVVLFSALNEIHAWYLEPDRAAEIKKEERALR